MGQMETLERRTYILPAADEREIWRVDMNPLTKDEKRRKELSMLATDMA